MSDRLPPERRGNWLFLSERYDIEWLKDRWVIGEAPFYERIALQIPNIAHVASYTSELWSGALIYMVGPGTEEDSLICVDYSFDELITALENPAK